MYDELIKRLRETSKDFGELDNVSVMLLEAANAIEDLFAELREEKVDNINLTGWLAEEYAKHLWIPVTERLPEEYTRVIGFMAWKGMTAIEYQNGKWYLIDHLEPLPDEAITHWMPLPEPPKEES